MSLSYDLTRERGTGGVFIVNNGDAANSGFYTELVRHVSEAVIIPVIASGGSGKVEHFSGVFQKTDVEAALAAGIFHREEAPIEAVKEHMRDKGIETQ